jgi:homoserine O-acetyltransferase
LEYQAMRFNERFDANAYLYITKAMDYWDLGATDVALAAALTPWQGETLLISFDSDWLYPTAESERIATVLRQQNKPVCCYELQSAAGHDAFLLEFAQQTPIIQAYLARFDAVSVPS